MGTKYLIDTNTAIDFLEGILPSTAMITLENMIINGECCLSIINRIELFSIILPPASFVATNNLVSALPIIELSNAVADRTITLRQLYKSKMPDAIIAGTCIEHNLTLISRNTSDFSKISGLLLLDPFKI
jgi:predicted nucleic acid-binding protein